MRLVASASNVDHSREHANDTLSSAAATETSDGYHHPSKLDSPWIGSRIEVVSKKDKYSPSFVLLLFSRGEFCL